MAKLWQKNNLPKNELAKIVEQFTVGNDRNLDLLLAKYDVIGSLAHTKMLAQVGLLTKEELAPIQKELKNMLTIQLNDNTKARLLHHNQYNHYKSTPGKNKVRSQEEIYNYLKTKN